MTSHYAAEMQAEQHRADLRHEARSAHLVAIAVCRRDWAFTARRAAARLRAAVRRGQPTVACCPA